MSTELFCFEQKCPNCGGPCDIASVKTVFCSADELEITRGIVEIEFNSPRKDGPSMYFMCRKCELGGSFIVEIDFENGQLVMRLLDPDEPC